MILTILSIENRIVKCKFDGNDAVLEIARRWFTEDIRDGDKIEIKIYNNKPKSVLEIKDK